MGDGSQASKGFFYLQGERKFAQVRCCLARAPNGKQNKAASVRRRPVAQTRRLRMGVAIAKVRQTNTSSETLAISINIGRAYQANRR